MQSFSELALLESPLEPGLTVIEASAGTGKTYSISHLVPRMLLEGILPDLSKLLLVTFTNDAARELAERVRRVLTRLATPPTGDEVTRHPHVAALRCLLNNPEAKTRLDRALLDLDLLAVSTINAFCQRTLQQEGSLCGLPVLPEVTTDDSEHLETVVNSIWTTELSADATVAALATELTWKLADALKLIRTLRRAQSPQIAPFVPPFSELRQEITTHCAALADKISFQSFATLIGRVSAWNKGVGSTDAALAQVRPISAGETHTITYWQSLEFALELPGKIKAHSNTAKALKNEVGGHRWLVAVAALKAITRRLEWAWQQHLAAAALPRLATLLAHRRLITQDGLIVGLYHALHRETAEGKEQSASLAAHLAARYHVALIDESQDTDPRQLAIFQRIFNHPAHPRRLILVGDPKQAIYSFRGADLSTYLAARNTADAGYTLTHTHRAPQPLVTTVNGLFQRPLGFHHLNMMFVPAVSALPYDRQLFYLGKPCSRLEAWIVPETESYRYSAKERRIPAISARVATTIVDLLHDGELRTTYDDNRPTESCRVTPRDCAVLVATHDQAQWMAEALLALDVPVVINSGADIFATDEARELHLLLRALLDPRRTSRLRSALATRLMGLDAVKLAALDKPGNDGQHPSVVWLDEFEKWKKTWMTRGLTALFAALDGSIHEAPIASEGITLRLARVPLTGERRATRQTGGRAAASPERGAE